MQKNHTAHHSVANKYHDGGSRRFVVTVGSLAGLLLSGMALNLCIGSVPLPVSALPVLLGDALSQGTKQLFAGPYATQARILFSIRMPRMLLSVLLGGALSVSGYLLQVFFRNPIVGPFELGISSGAKMLVGITLIFFGKMAVSLNSLTLVLAAFAGSVLVTGIVLLFSQKVSNMSMLLVIGIMVGYVCSAVTDFCIAFADDRDIVNLTNWSMGSFSGASWPQCKVAFAFCVLGLCLSALISKPMGAYALGEGYAKSMGVHVKRFRFLLILLSCGFSACVTAFAGPISFVGIAVPHITRILLKSSKPARMILAVFLCGAVFCVFCDLLARTVLAPTEIRISTVTAVFGAPVVIYMMLNRKAREE